MSVVILMSDRAGKTRQLQYYVLCDSAQQFVSRTPCPDISSAAGAARLP
jgi:hypothetical protein